MVKQVCRFASWSRPAYFHAAYGPRAWYWRVWPTGTELRSRVYLPGSSWQEKLLKLSAIESDYMAKKVVLGSAGLPDLIPLADAGEWRAKFPLLMGYLTDPTYDDQTPRRPGRLFISAERGSWSCVLKDPNQGIQLEVVVDLPTDMFPALEAALGCPNPPWRVDHWAKQPVARKKK